MKNNIVKWLSLLCGVVTVIGLAACDVLGASSSEDSAVQSSIEEENSEEIVGSQGLEYELSLDRKSYYVTGIGSCQDTDLVIPATYEGLPVASIFDNAFLGCSRFTSVVIPDSVRWIGEWAFASCNSLTSVEIGESVTRILDNAFFSCKNLTSVAIPDSVTDIGESAFLECDSLESVRIGDGITKIGPYAFWYCESLTSVYYAGDIAGWCNIEGVFAIMYGQAKELYIDNALVTDVVIPDNVTSIGNRVFSNCSSLTSVVIPDSVTSIGNSAFAYCSSLTSVTLPNHINRIDSSMFEGCSSLTSVVIPDSITSIGDYAFQYCSSLTSITFNGTIAQWNAISKGGDWNYECPATEVVCTDGTVAI